MMVAMQVCAAATVCHLTYRCVKWMNGWMNEWFWKCLADDGQQQQDSAEVFPLKMALTKPKSDNSLLSFFFWGNSSGNCVYVLYVCMVGMKTFTDHRGGLNSSSLRKSTLGFDPLANGSNSPGVGRFNNFEDCRYFFFKQIFRMHAFFFLFQRGVSCGRVRRHRWSERFRIAHTRFMHSFMRI